MNPDVKSAFSPALIDFCRRLGLTGIHPCSADAMEVAAHFRAVFQLSLPIEFWDVGILISKLAYQSIQLSPTLEQESGVRGAWFANDTVVKIIIDASRPAASQIKTLFHELAEQILEISHSLDPSVSKPKEEAQERWANRFAAMCKMPPNIFRQDAVKYGLDLRELAALYKDTIAGVSRQVRDLIALDDVCLLLDITPPTARKYLTHLEAAGLIVENQKAKYDPKAFWSITDSPFRLPFE